MGIPLVDFVGSAKLCITYREKMQAEEGGDEKVGDGEGEKSIHQGKPPTTIMQHVVT